MNEIIKTILERRSIRNFNDQKIKTEDLKLIVDCALHAPSGMGKDTWYFAIINNQAMIDELINIMQELLGNKDYTMYHPKAIIIPANKKDNHHSVEDNACALENIFLAAKSLKIGSVWINQLRHYDDSEKLRAFYQKIGIDDTMMVTGIASLGYYDEEPKEKVRHGKYQIFE